MLLIGIPGCPHTSEVCLSVRVCACMLGTEPIAELTPPPPLLHFPSLQVFPRLTFLLRVLSKQNQINAAVPPSPSLPYACTHKCIGTFNVHQWFPFSLTMTSPSISSAFSSTCMLCLTEKKKSWVSVSLSHPDPYYWPNINQPWPVSKCGQADLRGGSEQLC